MSSQIKELQSQSNSKANINDVCALVDSKANSNQVFQVMDEMKKSITLLSGKMDSDFGSYGHMESFMT